jgi:hypothetical protein
MTTTPNFRAEILDQDSQLLAIVEVGLFEAESRGLLRILKTLPEHTDFQRRNASILRFVRDGKTISLRVEKIQQILNRPLEYSFSYLR